MVTLAPKYRAGTQGPGGGPRAPCPLWNHHFSGAVPELLNSRGFRQPVQESLGCAMAPQGGEELEQAGICCAYLFPPVLFIFQRSFQKKCIRGLHKDFWDHNQARLPMQRCKGGYCKGAKK